MHCVVSRLLSPPRCVSHSLPGDRRGSGDPLEQHHLPRLAPSGRWERRGDVLGGLLLESKLQCSLESRRAMCASQLHAGEGLPHLLPARAPPGVPRPPSAALKGKERLHLDQLLKCLFRWHSH